MKCERYKKSLITTIKFFTLFFIYGKGYIFLKNIVWENVIYTIAFLLNFFLVF